MTPARSFVGTITGFGFLRKFRFRCLVFGTLIGLSLLLALFPERYNAAVSLSPTDPASLGLSGTLGQLGALNSVFGNQAAVEVAMRVGKSVNVRNIVIDKAKLEKRLNMSRLELHRWLYDKVEIRSLRGGVIIIEMKDRDPKLAYDIVGVAAAAMQEGLAQISRNQTAYKRDVLVKLVADASDDLAKAQAAYDTFRLRNRTAMPISEPDLVTQRIQMLEGTIKAKQVALTSARQLYTDDNITVRQAIAEIGALQRQLAEAKATSPNQDTTVGRAVALSSQMYKLERDVVVLRSLYDSYLKYLEGTAVENLTSTANVRIIEQPYVDTERQLWWPAIGAGIAFLLLWGAIEFYRLRPPIGARIGPEYA